MSKRVMTSWTCPACATATQCQIIKPNVLAPTVTRETCPDCKSLFSIQWAKIAGKFQFRWTIFSYTLSEVGQKKFDLKNNKPKRAKPAEQRSTENAGV